MESSEFQTVENVNEETSSISFKNAWQFRLEKKSGVMTAYYVLNFMKKSFKAEAIELFQLLEINLDMYHLYNTKTLNFACLLACVFATMHTKSYI